jgi:hypothetical protein
LYADENFEGRKELDKMVAERSEKGITTNISKATTPRKKPKKKKKKKKEMIEDIVNNSVCRIFKKKNVDFVSHHHRKNQIQLYI